MTTLYFTNNTGVVFPLPVYSSYWTNTSGAERVWLSTGKSGNLEPLPKTGSFYASSGEAYLNRQYLSPGLSGQVITGNFWGQIQCKESNSSDNLQMALVIKLISKVGGYRQDLFSGKIGQEFYTGIRNISFSGQLPSGNVNLSDYLVVEIGFNKFSGVGYNVTGIQKFGNPDFPNLPLDNSTTATGYCPFISFSDDLVFKV